MTLAIWITRILLAAIFLTSGLLKAGASENFAITIGKFSILPPAAITTFAITLPWLEILTALLLVIPGTARLGALLAALLFATFITALTWALSQGLIVDCGCFGETAPSQSKMIITLTRDIVLLALTLTIAARSPR